MTDHVAPELLLLGAVPQAGDDRVVPHQAALRHEAVERRLDAVAPQVVVVELVEQPAGQGSLAGEDGINVISGTGSMTYGERQGLGHRVGGWGELFGDEGSAYWVATQGLNASAG